VWLGGINDSKNVQRKINQEIEAMKDSSPKNLITARIEEAEVAEVTDKKPAAAKK